jgi:hypothetical protein
VKSLYTSLNWIAPTELHGTPKRASVGRCTIRCCIGKKKPGGKIFSSSQTNSGAIFQVM